MNPKDLYLKSCEKNRRLTSSEEEIIAKDADYSFLYAKKICNGPFVKGEVEIKKDPYNAFLYCRDVIKQRWHDAEDVIKKDPFSAYSYSAKVIKGRWPEAEKYIKKSSKWACAYAVDLIKGRWKEAENTIAKNQYAAHDYYFGIIKGNWTNWGFEDIGRSTVWMYYYAKKISDKLPEELHVKMLCKRDEFYYEYMEFLNGKN